MAVGTLSMIKLSLVGVNNFELVINSYRKLDIEADFGAYAR